MRLLTEFHQAKAAERKEAESTKAMIVQVDDLLSFRQFSKKSADEAIDVSIGVLSTQESKILTKILHSTTRTLDVLLVAQKSEKILYPI